MKKSIDISEKRIIKDFSNTKMFEANNPDIVSKIKNDIKDKSLTEKIEYLMHTFYMDNGWKKMSRETYDDVDILFNDYLNIDAIFVHKIRKTNYYDDSDIIRFYEEIRYLIVCRNKLYMKNYFRNVYMKEIEKNKYDELNSEIDVIEYKNQKDILRFLNIENII